MNFSNIEITLNGDAASLKIDGKDFPTVSEFTLHFKAGEVPTLDLKMFCIELKK